MWNDTELQHDIENEVGWELSASLTQISVTVKSGAVELVLRPLGRVLFVTELVARRFSIELPVDLRPILIHLAIPGASFPS